MSRGWQQVLAAGGLAFVVLQITSQSLIQVGGMEPSFAASADAALAFFEVRDDALFRIGGYLSAISFLALIGFLAALWRVLSTAEGGREGLALGAVGSGLALAALLLAGHGYWGMAQFRVDEGLTPEVAQVLFDLGNYTFATSWVLSAGLVLFTGAAVLQARALPRWLGWPSIVLGVALLAGRAAWTSPVAFAPYVLYWAWLIAVSVVLIRRAGAPDPTDGRT